MSIFDSNNTGIALTLDVPWPANVGSGPGVQVDKTNAQFLVSLDFPNLVDGGTPSTPSNVYLAGYDTGLAQYEKLRLDNLIASATGVDSRTAIGNANYAVLITDHYVALAATLTAIRTITLPAASSVPAGRLLTVQDETGAISPAFYLVFAPTGGDTFNGASSWTLKTKRGGVSFRSNGTNAWNVLSVKGRSPVADTSYTATRDDQLIAYTSISAARIVTLPAASAFQVGQKLTVIDESGSCSGANTITLARVGADTINGAVSASIGQAYGYVAVESDGVSKWTIITTAALSSGTITASQISDSTALGRSVVTGARTVVGNAIYTVLATDRLVVTSVALTAPRIWTLPAANAVAAGTEITFFDEAGAATPTNTVSIARAGADTINGAVANQVVLGLGARQRTSIRSDGVSNWTRPSLYGALDGSTVGATTAASVTATSLAINAGGFQVAGRLTLTSGTPVLTGAVAAASTLYWTPYDGNLVPLWDVDNARFIWTPITELSNALGNSAAGNAGPAAAVANKVYDLFLWSNSGVPTLTRGPKWDDGTGGSNTVRGTGAGGAALTRVNGILVNAASITNGPGAAGGTYVGTVMTDAGGGTVTWTLGGSSAGGTAGVIGLWNAYNRIDAGIHVIDSTANWTQTSATQTPLNTSTNNRFSFVIGQAGITNVDARLYYAVSIPGIAAAFAYLGLWLDAASGALLNTSIMANAAASSAIVMTPYVSGLYTGLLGSHFVQAGQAADGTHTVTYLGNTNGLFGTLKY